mmetsp:Transcript_21289/g.63431  ORF Transcript_21289/g.63431 Transcript_21289/m.63431 type:complete len:180 (+) Transcript_21289:109-648(+)
MPISWDIVFKDGKHKISLVHNTLSGHRTVRFDGKVIYRSGWMFKLVGQSQFTVSHGGKDHRCTLRISPDGLMYKYGLTVDGKTLAQHSESMRRVHRTWTVMVGGAEHIVVLERDKMVVCVDGEEVQIEDEFVDDGTEASFTVAGAPAYLHTATDGGKVVQTLYVDDEEIPEKFENRLLI